MAGRMLRHSGHAARACATDVGSVLALVFGERIPAFALELYGPRGLRLLLNIATALLVLALPLTAAAQSQLTASDQPVLLAQVATYASENSTARVTTAARGVSAGSRSPVTVAASDVAEIPHYTVKSGETLSGIAAQYGVDMDEVAFANHLDDDGIGAGDVLVIPPGRGALYTVKEGDTIASVAARFKVGQSAIEIYNRRRRDGLGRGRRSSRLRAALRRPADLLLPHELRLRDTGTDRGARPAHRRDRHDRRNDRSSRPLGSEAQRRRRQSTLLLAAAKPRTPLVPFLCVPCRSR